MFSPPAQRYGYADPVRVSVHQGEHSMLFQEFRWLWSLVPILLLLSEVCSFPQVGERRLYCYVCGREDQEPCGNTTSVPSAISIKMCPEKAQGCMTVAEGDEVTRSCTDLKLSDCKRANGKIYCYCESAVCNNQSVSALSSMLRDDVVTPSAPPTEKATNSPNEWRRLMKNIDKSSSEGYEDVLGDDEDLFDGSADGELHPKESPKDDDIIKSVVLPPTTQSAPSSRTEISSELPPRTTIRTREEDKKSSSTLSPREPNRATGTKSASMISLGFVSVAALSLSCRCVF